MAGPFWEPLSPSPPLLHPASLTLTLSGSVLSSAPIPPSRPVLSPRSPDTPTFPFSPLEGSSPCLAGLGCLDLLPIPRRWSFSTTNASRRRQSGGGGGGGGPSLTAGQGPHLKFPGARDTPEGARALAYPVAALPAGRTERPGRLAGHCITFPFALFPAFIGGRIAFPPVAVWGRWGGAVEPGLRRAVSRKGSRCSH